MGLLVALSTCIIRDLLIGVKSLKNDPLFRQVLEYSILIGLFGSIAYNYLDGSNKPVSRQTGGKPSAVQKEDKKFVQLYQKGRPLPFKNEIIGQTISEEELNKQVKTFGYTVKKV